MGGGGGLPEGSLGGDTAEVEQAVPIATLWLDECVRPSDPRDFSLEASVGDALRASNVDPGDQSQELTAPAGESASVS